MSMWQRLVVCYHVWSSLRHLKLAHQVFYAAEQLSINLQAKYFTVQDAVKGASLLSSHFHSLNVLDIVGKDFDQECLLCQLSLIPDMIKTASDGSIKKATYIRTIADTMQSNSIYQGMFSVVFKLVKTFPVIMAKEEKSFSSQRRLKTFLKSQITDSSRTDELDLEEIAKIFVCVNSSKMENFNKKSAVFTSCLSASRALETSLLSSMRDGLAP